MVVQAEVSSTQPLMERALEAIARSHVYVRTARRECLVVVWNVLRDNECIIPTLCYFLQINRHKPCLLFHVWQPACVGGYFFFFWHPPCDVCSMKSQPLCSYCCKQALSVRRIRIYRRHERSTNKSRTSYVPPPIVHAVSKQDRDNKCMFKPNKYVSQGHSKSVAPSLAPDVGASRGQRTVSTPVHKYVISFRSPIFLRTLRKH